MATNGYWARKALILREILKVSLTCVDCFVLLTRGPGRNFVHAHALFNVVDIPQVRKVYDNHK